MSSRLNFGENGSSDDEMSVLTYSKDGEIFVFLYDDDEQLWQAIMNSVTNPKSNLTWHDAAILGQIHKKKKQLGIRKLTRAEIYERLLKSFQDIS